MGSSPTCSGIAAAAATTFFSFGAFLGAAGAFSAFFSFAAFTGVAATSSLTSFSSAKVPAPLAAFIRASKAVLEIHISNKNSARSSSVAALKAPNTSPNEIRPDTARLDPSPTMFSDAAAALISDSGCLGLYSCLMLYFLLFQQGASTSVNFFGGALFPFLFLSTPFC